jgi:hypothetical protein
MGKCKYTKKFEGNNRSEILKRFLNKISYNNDCWEWIAGKDNHGYGKMWIINKNILSSRVSWLLFKGDIPENICVCHKCDNPACANPDHLFLGTHKDNMHDMTVKGRHGSTAHPEMFPRGDQSPSRLHPERLKRGSNHSNSKLTEENVKEIRLLYSTKKYSYQKLADKYGVVRSAIQKIIEGTAWKHVL